MPAPVATSSVALAASGALRRGALLLRRTGGAAAAGSGAHRPQPPQQRSCASARTFHVSVSAAADEPSSSGQQLPRFFTESPLLNVGTGMTVQLTAEEGKHARKVLRLKPGAPVELCDGEGRVARAQMLDGAREVTVLTTSAAVEVPWEGPRWVVAAACGSLKGGRADWLVEKCSELGADALLPVLTERSPTVGRGDVDDDASGGGSGGGGRSGRWDRIAQASSKQCLRTHKLRVLAPATVGQLEKLVKAGKGVSLLAMQGGAPLHEVLNGEAATSRAEGGLLIVGPEGDFTAAEKAAIVAAGAKGIGLGSLRLRVETAAIGLLSAVSFWPPARRR